MMYYSCVTIPEYPVSGICRRKFVNDSGVIAGVIHNND
jgi:hypothetical protein